MYQSIYIFEQIQNIIKPNLHQSNWDTMEKNGFRSFTRSDSQYPSIQSCCGGTMTVTDGGETAAVHSWEATAVNALGMAVAWMVRENKLLMGLGVGLLF